MGEALVLIGLMTYVHVNCCDLRVLFLAESFHSLVHSLVVRLYFNYLTVVVYIYISSSHCRLRSL